MMKKLFIILILFLGSIMAFGQVKKDTILPNRNSIYLEAFGQGLYDSFSYDRLFHLNNKIKTSFTSGITIVPGSEFCVFGVPVSYNFLFGQKSHHLELGLGFTIMYMRQQGWTTEGMTDQNGVIKWDTYLEHTNNFYSFFTPKIGYRFQKPHGGFFMRFTLAPVIACVNRLGPEVGSKFSDNRSEIQLFSSAAFFEPYKIFPWAGISFGYTLKSNNIR